MSIIKNNKILKKKYCNLNSIIYFSTVDWHGHSSITLFFNKCSFRCSYCYNTSCISGKKNILIKTIKKEILKSKGYVRSIVFLGGEATMQLESLIKLATFSKKNNFLVGLHTNGYYLNNIKKLIRLNIIDKFFVDIKAPLNYKKYSHVTNKYTKDIINNISQSIKIIDSSTSELELKTTLFPTIIGTEKDIIEISKWINKYIKFKNKTTYVLQQGIPDNTLDKKLRNINPCTDSQIKK